MSKKFELNIITPTDTFYYSDVEYLRAQTSVDEVRENKYVYRTFDND